jgi:hypothetical protein
VPNEPGTSKTVKFWAVTIVEAKNRNDARETAILMALIPSFWGKGGEFKDEH